VETPLPPAEALRVLTSLVEKHPDMPGYSLELALAHKAMRDIPTSLQLLVQASKRFPGNPRIAYHLGRTLLEAGRDTEAVLPLQSALRAQPDDLQIILALGQALQRTGRDKEALALAEQAIRIDADAPEPYLLRAAVRAQAGLTKEALQDCEAYRARSPEPGPGYLAMGRIYLQMRDAANSETLLRRAADAMPQSPEAWQVLGQALLELQPAAKLSDAVQCLERSRELAPNRAETYTLLGRARTAQGRAEEAVLAYREAVRLSPNPMPIQKELADALAKAGMTQEAAVAGRAYESYRQMRAEVDRRTRAIEADPKNRSAWISLAGLLMEKRQYRAVVSLLEDARRRAGSDARTEAMLQQARRMLQETTR
jgi:tetratricopeptide (TPR) repeat protein